MSALEDFAPLSLREAMAALDGRTRLLQFHGPTPDAALVVERACVREGVNRLFRIEVDLLGPTARLDNAALLGEEITISLRDADGALRNWHGLVTEARRLGSDGGLHRYRLVAEPWLALLAHRSDCYLFQDLDAIGIVEALLADYRPLARFELRLDERWRARLPVYRVRSQWNETDLDFLLRVLADDGLSFFFEHDEAPSLTPTHTTSPATSSESGPRHRLVIVDAGHDWPGLAPSRLAYRRSAAIGAGDAVHAFAGTVDAGAACVTRAAWDAAAVFAPAAIAQAEPGGPLLPRLEDYDGSLALPPTASAPADAVALRAELAALRHAQQRRRWRGLSSVRRLHPARTFTLDGHPDWPATGSARGFGRLNPSACFVVREIEHRMRNNLRLGDARLAPTGRAEAPEAPDVPIYENEFTAVAAAQPLVPAARAPAAPPGLQTALVVGIANEAITARRDHEVKLQFHWQRGAHANRGGAIDTGTADFAAGLDEGNAPGDERSGTWVRVAQSFAGPGYGELFLPRIGDEVLVDFEHGDPDRPVVVAALWNGEDPPPFAAGVDGDADHAGVISGLHATTLDGAGYNELVFDDAAGQSGLRAASSQYGSQLNLGHLLNTRPGLAWRGPVRGQGFEWTTEGWTVARAARGLLLTSQLRAAAAGMQLDNVEAQSGIRAARVRTQALSDAAGRRGAASLDGALRAQQGLLDSLAATVELAAPSARPQAPVPAFASPLLLLDSAASAVFATPATLLSHAAGGHAIGIGGDALLSAGATWSSISGLATSLYTHGGGITVVAAGGAVSIQAQAGPLELLADRSVAITSTDAGLRIVADRRIVLRAGGAAITMDGEDITFACPGWFSVRGSDIGWERAARGQATMPHLPAGTVAPKPDDLEFRYAHHDGEPVRGAAYTLRLGDGSSREGSLDDEGCLRLSGLTPGAAQITVGSDSRVYEQFKLPLAPDADLEAWCRPPDPDPDSNPGPDSGSTP